MLSSAVPASLLAVEASEGDSKDVCHDRTALGLIQICGDRRGGGWGEDGDVLITIIIIIT